jgi:hypothetical protein
MPGVLLFSFPPEAEPSSKDSLWRSVFLSAVGGSTSYEFILMPEGDGGALLRPFSQPSILLERGVGVLEAASPEKGAHRQTGLHNHTLWGRFHPGGYGPQAQKTDPSGEAG